MAYLSRRKRLSCFQCFTLQLLVQLGRASFVLFFLWITTTTTGIDAAMSLPTAVASPPSSSHGSHHRPLLRVLVLRHGQTDANANDIIQGSSDISRLTDLGRQQAAQVVQALQEPQQQHMDDDFLSSSSSRIPISNVYVSPLTRAQETLQVICTHIELPPAETLSNLREIDFYDWEGRDRTYLQQHYPDAWRAWKEGNPDELIVHETKDDDSAMVHRPLWELWERAGTVWDEIFTRQDNTSVDFKMSSFPVSILIVAHGSLGQALLGTAMGWDATHFRQYEFPNCGMIELIWEEDDDDDVAMTTLPDTTQGVESSFSSSSSAAASAASRPLATRWRWKWPNVSDEWYTLDAKR